MAEIAVSQIRAFLTEVGQRYQQPAMLLLLGGSALCLLGSFLMRQGLITLEQLEIVVNTAVVRAQEFNLNSTAMRDHLQAVHSQL